MNLYRNHSQSISSKNIHPSVHNQAKINPKTQTVTIPAPYVFIINSLSYSKNFCPPFPVVSIKRRTSIITCSPSKMQIKFNAK